MPRALTFALLVALAAFALAAFSPALLNDGDTYWHIRAGEWMIAHGAVLRADLFSATVAGAPWHTQEWLAEILMALSRRGGWLGVHLLFAACAALTAGVTALFVRRRVDFVPALLAMVLGLACVTGSLLARPHILALPLLAIWTAGMVAAREKNAAPSWWLILVMPLWANLHGSFAFGLALAGALAVEAVIESADRKKAALGWGLFLLAAIVSAVITPFGLQTLLFPLQLSAMLGLGHIGEWQASDFTQLSPFAIALLTALFVLGSGKLKIPAIRLLILLGLVWLALVHGRHQMLLGVTAPILLAASLARPWPAKQQNSPRSFAVLAALGFVALIAARLAIPVARGDDPVSPVSALAHVPRFVRETPVLNDYSFGGYLIWNGVKPFIDSRADLYGDIFLQNYADITAPDKDALAAALTFYHVRWTIFSARAPVVKLLDATPGWHRFYSDKLAVVHVHD
ncbi:MAG TPA: hypothetical protein VNN98_04145 [Rhizomicrobium sp.]|nr:hypothetical protein [Rhizomicrobium sp.]